MKILSVLFSAMLFMTVGAAGALAASEAKIVATDPGANDDFGYSVGISGDYAVVGSPYEDSMATDAGAAYIYHRTATNTWDSGVKIMASDGQADDNFGYNVAVSGDYAVVGAPNEDAMATDAGAVYVYNRTATNTWDAGVKIMASDGQASDLFGYCVGISGDYIIVGAKNEDAGGDDAGAAYIFMRTGTNTWDSGVKIVASDAETLDYFGQSVAISGDYAIVGAKGEDAGGSDAGAAYLYLRTASNTWNAGTKIVAGDPAASDNFGMAVAISGDYAVVGAYRDDEAATNAGAVYSFLRTGSTTWDSGTKLLASDPEDSDYFGRSVGISGPYIVAGAYQEDAGGADAGAMYLFSRTGSNTWSAATKILPSDPEAGDIFGRYVAIYGYYALAGSPYDDPSALSSAGSAYIIKHDLPTAIDLLSFAAEWTDDGAILSWATGSETDCGAFTILRCELAEVLNDAGPVCQTDEYQELDLVIPCEDNFLGAEYEALDATADPAADYAYMLREYQTTGGMGQYGPALLYGDKYGNDWSGDDDAGDSTDDDDVSGGDESDDDSATSAEQARDGAEDDEAGCGM